MFCLLRYINNVVIFYFEMIENLLNNLVMKIYLLFCCFYCRCLYLSLLSTVVLILLNKTNSLDLQNQLISLLTKALSNILTVLLIRKYYIQADRRCIIVYSQIITKRVSKIVTIDTYR